MFLFFSASVFSQEKMDRILKNLNKESVTYAYVKDINTTDDIVFLDSRKKEEFNVSHLKDAIWVGYKTYEQEMVNAKILKKDTPIIVYCSIGVRSENIGEKLQKAGYTNVKNLYGGIFEWKNQDKKVYNNKTVETDSVHAFNKHWGKLLLKGVKVYD
jgi:rhodanese-related sulfurtransferase